MEATFCPNPFISSWLVCVQTKTTTQKHSLMNDEKQAGTSQRLKESMRVLQG
jgi:hypothetical protein